MKYQLLFIVLLMFACKDEPKASTVADTKEVLEADAIAETVTELPFEVFDYDGLQPLISKEDDKIHVVNFWATWCAPCIKELPYFQEIEAKYNDKGVELLLVSLDFPRQYESKLVPFLQKKGIKSKVVALDDVDQNRWIPAIDSTWSGALPATIIYNKNKRSFYERSFTYDELETEIKSFLN